MFRFAILGSVQLTDGATEVAVGGPRQVALLAYLLLHANQPVSSDELIEALWSGGHMGGAPKRLTVAIARLRRALATSGLDPMSTLSTTSNGYRLSADAEELDAVIFERLAADARNALGAGQATRAREGAAAALALWRGRPLADVEYESFAQAEVRRLRELRLEVLETRIEADVRLGAHVAVVPELEGLLASHPTRERFAGQLMLALYRSGRQADALDAYQRVREYLDRELGLQPGAALNELQASILEQASALDATPASDDAGDVGRAAADPPGRLPRPLLATTDSALIGRDTQLEQLRAALQRAARGEQRLALLSGEPGIGKTRLMAAFVDDALTETGVVMYGRSSPEPLLAYQPFAEALRRYVTDAPAATLLELPAHVAAELTRLMPSLRQRLPDLPDPVSDDVDGLRTRLFDAVASLIGTVARGRTVVLLLDDVHWADRASVLLLTYLLRYGEPANLLCVAATRDTEGPARPELARLIADLQSEDRLDHVALHGLTEPEVADLASARAPNVSSTTSHEVYVRSGGNPFFAVELLAGIAEGAFGPRAGQSGPAAATPVLPRQVTQAIDARIGRLSPTAAALVSHAALLAPDIDAGTLRHVGRVPEDELIDAMDELIDAGVLTDADRRGARYVFRHDLIREAVLERLTPLRRAHLHAQTATALGREQAGHERLGAIARHLLAAAPAAATAAEARHAATAAARAATAQLAHDDAAGFLEIALESLALEREPPEHERCELLLQHGDAQLRAGELAAARQSFAQALEAARVTADPLRLARAALGLGGGRVWATAGDVDAELVSALEEALRELASTELAMRARLLSRLATETYWSEGGDRGGLLGDEALATARRSGDTIALEAALHAAYVGHLRPDHLPEREALVAEMIAVSRASGDRSTEMAALHLSIAPALERGDLASVDDACARYERTAEELHQPLAGWHAARWRAMRALLAGRLDDVEPLALGAHALGQRARDQQDPSRPLGFGIELDLGLDQTLGLQLATLRWDQGRLDELVSILTAAVDRDRALPGWRAPLALALAEVGDSVAARATLDQLATDAFGALPRDLTWMGALAIACEAASVLEDRPAAAAIRPLLDPFADRVLVVGLHATVCLGAVGHYLGIAARLTGEHDDAVRLLDAALAVNERLGARARIARTSLEYARALRERGQPGDHATVDGLLGRAATIAEEIGMRGVVRQIADLAAGREHASSW